MCRQRFALALAFLLPYKFKKFVAVVGV